MSEWVWTLTKCDVLLLKCEMRRGHAYMHAYIHAYIRTYVRSGWVSGVAKHWRWRGKGMCFWELADVLFVQKQYNRPYPYQMTGSLAMTASIPPRTAWSAHSRARCMYVCMYVIMCFIPVIVSRGFRSTHPIQWGEIVESRYAIFPYQSTGRLE